MIAMSERWRSRRRWRTSRRGARTKGVLDDVRLRVEKIDSKCDRVVFNNMPHNAGLLCHPTPAAANAAFGSDIKLPKGPSVETTTRDIGFGVITT
jgi:hypothetical protein